MILAGLLDRFFVLVVVFARMSGLALSAPLLSSKEVPVQVRAWLAFGLSVLVTPLVSMQPMSEMAGVFGLGLVIGSELALGFILGLGVMLLLQGLQLAGEIVARVAGLGMGDVYDPMSDSEVSGVGRLLLVVGTLAFLVCGGERQLLAGILESFRVLKPGTLLTVAESAQVLVDALAASFSLAVRIAAPALAALLTVTLALGLINRTLPQLNLLMLGFGLNGLAAMGVLLFAGGFFVTIFEEELSAAWERVFPWLVGQ